MLNDAYSDFIVYRFAEAINSVNQQEGSKSRPTHNLGLTMNLHQQYKGGINLRKSWKGLVRKALLWSR